MNVLSVFVQTSLYKPCNFSVGFSKEKVNMILIFARQTLFNVLHLSRLVYTNLAHKAVLWAG